MKFKNPTKTMKKLESSSFMITLMLSVLLSPAAHASKELARINDSVITLEEFHKKYRENLGYFKLKQPSKQSVLDDLIKRELGIQEAKRLNLDKDPQIVERMNTVLYHALLEKKLAPKLDAIHVSHEDLKEYYQKNPILRTSHIFVGVRPDAKPEEKKQALSKISTIYKNHVLRKGASFAEVAQRFSEGPAAPMGGDLDFRSREKLDPIYYEAALKLKEPGKVSRVVETPSGYHIIKLTGIKPWKDVDQTELRRLVFEKKREEIFDHYMAELKTNSRIQINQKLIPEEEESKKNTANRQ